jgi:glyoxylase-like metal-dependent hydrolase (beta-lactamase superfamily II)
MIDITSFTFSPFQENTYVLYNEAKECIIVDPGCYDRSEQKVLESFISKNGLKPIALLNTHCHLDHVFGNKFVSDKYGLKPYIHPKDQPVLDSVKMVVDMYGLNYDESPAPQYFEGNQFSAGQFKLDILFVPGHSPGHVAFYNPENKLLISGDTLFKNSIGRTDLPGGDSDTLFESIRSQLFTLPDDTKVYPGHMDPTEIGFEKKTNPFFK